MTLSDYNSVDSRIKTFESKIAELEGSLREKTTIINTLNNNNKGSNNTNNNDN